MEDLAGKNIVMFCPKFFGYEKEIQKTLEGYGANVSWYDDRPSNDFLSKALIRLNKNVLTSKIERYYIQVMSEIRQRGMSVDYFFFVNPESITKDSLTKLKKEHSSARFILYMWDSFQNRKKTAELLPLFDYKFTFDPDNAEQYQMKLRPLFFSEVYKKKETGPIKYDLLFIGTAHSDRYTFVKRITTSLPAEMKLKLYFFLSSRKLFYIKKIMDRDFRRVAYKDISFRSLTHQDNAELMNQSKVILDINHPRQIGLTMRTLETLGVQRKLITTNADIKRYDFYNPRNILLIDRQNPVIPKGFFEQDFDPLADHILFKYSIKGWVTEIFNL